MYFIGFVLVFLRTHTFLLLVLPMSMLLLLLLLLISFAGIYFVSSLFRRAMWPCERFDYRAPARNMIWFDCVRGRFSSVCECGCFVWSVCLLRRRIPSSWECITRLVRFERQRSVYRMRANQSKFPVISCVYRASRRKKKLFFFRNSLLLLLFIKIQKKIRNQYF